MKDFLDVVSNANSNRLRWAEGCKVLSDALNSDVVRCRRGRDLLEAEKKSWNTWYAYAWYGKGAALKGCTLGAAGALALRYVFKR